MISCPSGYEYFDGICLSCPNGYQNVDGECVSKCPAGWTDDGSYCIRPKDSKYKNTTGFNTQTECANVAGECYYCKGKYYPKCVTGYSEVCDECVLTCPGDGRTVGNCKKTTIKPTISPSSLTLTAIIIILSLLILAIIVLYQSLKYGRVTSDQVYDDEFGTPGRSDAYAIITGQRENEKLIYV